MNIGSNIKKLRRDRDITQEQLAEYLSISISAISQWESGKTTPDISLLAPLANVFNVSADVILGIDVVNKEKQIQDIISQAYNCALGDCSLSDCEKAVSILREGLKEYPNSYEIMERLMNWLINTKRGKTAEEALKLTNESIKLGEKILAECTDDKLRSWAVGQLCRAYSSPEAGMTEKAIELAEKLPHTMFTRESILAQLYDGEKKNKQLRENMLKSFTDLIVNIESYRKNSGIEKDIAISKKIITLIEVMVEDGNYGHFGKQMVGSYLEIAKDYAKANDHDKAIENLRFSADNAIKLDDTEYEQLNECTSLLFEGVQHKIRFLPNGYSFSLELLKQMQNTEFVPIRENKAFIEIEEKLKKYAK